MDPNCTECQRLWRDYAAATTLHIQRESQMKMAALEHNTKLVEELLPKVEVAEACRNAVRELIRFHDEDAHKGKAEATANGQ